MKKIIVMFAMFMGCVYAQPRLSWSRTIVTSGTALVNLNLEGSPNPAGLQVSFPVPPNAVIAPGSAITASEIFASNIVAGVATIVVVDTTNTGVTQNGVIATISFPTMSNVVFAPNNNLAVDKNSDLVAFNALSYYVGGYPVVGSGAILYWNSCDMNTDGVLNMLDIRNVIDQVDKVTSCTNGDLNGDMKCTIVDVQRVVNAVNGQSCRVN